MIDSCHASCHDKSSSFTAISCQLHSQKCVLQLQHTNFNPGSLATKRTSCRKTQRSSIFFGFPESSASCRRKKTKATKWSWHLQQKVASWTHLHGHHLCGKMKLLGNVQRSNATTNIFRFGLNFGADFAGEYQFLHIKFWKNPCKAASKEFLQIATFKESLGPSFHFSPSSSWSCCTQGLVFSMEGTDTTKETGCNCWVAHKIGALICMMPWQHSNGHAKPSS